MPIDLNIDVSAIVDGQNIDAADVLLPLGQLETAVEDLLNGDQPFEQLNFGVATEVTIASGAITITGSHHRVDTESNASSDDLDQIDGGAEGDILLLRLENAGRQVIVKHNTGNIYLASEADFALSSIHKTLALHYNGTKWTNIGGSSGGGVSVIVPRTVLGVDSANLDIINIPSGFSHLKLILELRTTEAVVNTSIDMRFNGDTGFNYDSRYLRWTGATVSGGSVVAAGTGWGSLLLPALGDSAAAGLYSNIEITIHNYLSTDEQRTMHHNGALGTSGIVIGGGTWDNNADAIDEINLAAISGSIKAGTAYTLLGVS